MRFTEQHLFTQKAFVNGIILFCCIIAIACYSPTSQAKKRKFVKKECLDCHEVFVEKFMSMKNIHPMTKEHKCESCHLRHGIVPKLLLKEAIFFEDERCMDGLI